MGVVMGPKKLAGSHVALSPEELFSRDPSVSFLSSFGIFFACKFLSHIMSPFTPFPPRVQGKAELQAFIFKIVLHVVW